MTNSFQPGVMNPTNQQAARPFNLNLATGNAPEFLIVPPGGWTTSRTSIGVYTSFGVQEGGRLSMLASGGGNTAVGDLLLRSPYFPVVAGGLYRGVILVGDVGNIAGGMELVLVNRAGAVINTFETPVAPTTMHPVNVATFVMGAVTEASVCIRALAIANIAPIIASGSYLERVGS